MEFHLMCGVPGCGKSTLSKRIPGHIVSTDAIRKFLWDDETVVKDDRLVFEIADAIIRYMLPKNDLIFDATNLKAESRAKYIDMAKGLGAYVTVHWIDCPIETALKRNAERARKVPIPIVKGFHKRLQQPSLSEGMDKIIVYRDDLKVLDEIVGG